jgi:Family of unknown function (DUF6644)
LLGFFEWLEHTSWASTIAQTGWMYMSLSVVHYFSLFVLVGTMGMIDLRVLGVAGRRWKAGLLAEQLFTWVWSALALALLSGFLMFATDAGDYFPDAVFRTKILLIVLAILFGVIVQRKVPQWDRLPAMSMQAKLVALVSLLLWIGAILAALEVSAYSGLG